MLKLDLTTTEAPIVTSWRPEARYDVQESSRIGLASRRALRSIDSADRIRSIDDQPAGLSGATETGNPVTGLLAHAAVRMHDTFQAFVAYWVFCPQFAKATTSSAGRMRRR